MWGTTFGVLRVPDKTTTPGGGPLFGVLRVPVEPTTPGGGPRLTGQPGRKVYPGGLGYPGRVTIRRANDCSMTFLGLFPIDFQFF